ncbi:MAG: PhzF family phenazine biosynthesis protein [Actinomycetota bacterium]|nr:PhzF family phenazine biosynthesis protein [Actinomycetota bacterium]
MSDLLDYHVVDVFTDTAFRGNPLAVVLDAEGLSTAEMQSMAREFNLSETVFPLPPDVAGADYRLRIFTPHTELPFAGHPSVGAAWLLASIGRLALTPPVTVVTQSCLAGVLPLSIESDDRTPTRVQLTGIPSYGDELDPAPLLAAVGLSAADYAGPPPRVAGTGIGWAFLSVRPDAVARAVPDAARLLVLADLGVEAGLSVSSWDGHCAHTRCFASGLGVLEDPATGSAALGYGAWLVAGGLAAGEGETSYLVEQGAEMSRHSRLEGTVVATAGEPVQCRIAGRVVAVASGQIVRP